MIATLRVALVLCFAGLTCADVLAIKVPINGFYSRDRDVIYYFDMPMPEADAKTFKVLRFPFYAMDAKRVFYHSFVIPNASPAHFVLMSESYSRDGKQVYFRGRPMPLLYRGKFKVLDENRHLSADHRFVFYENKPIPDSDPQSFQILNDWFWKDRNQVYFVIKDRFPEILMEADAESFTLDGLQNGRDRHRTYPLKDLLQRFQAAQPLQPS